MISWAFLVVTLIGALFTFNAYVPHKRTGPLIVPSFFAGWLTSELSSHHFAWQVVATMVFVWAGALEAWPGWVGLGITLASWGGLLALVPISRAAEPVVEAALAAGLGADYRDAVLPEIADRMERPSRTGVHLNPFSFNDPEVSVTRDIPYVPDGGPKHRLDVYRPKEGSERAPVLLQIHGGGWTIGNKREQALPLMNHLASRGWVRGELSPEPEGDLPRSPDRQQARYCVDPREHRRIRRRPGLHRGHGWIRGRTPLLHGGIDRQ